MIMIKKIKKKKCFNKWKILICNFDGQDVLNL